jgi:hypothetical protein
MADPASTLMSIVLRALAGAAMLLGVVATPAFGGEDVPVPQPRPVQAGAEVEPAPDAAEANPAAELPADGAANSKDIPKPEPRPAPPSETAGADKATTKDDVAAPPMVLPPTRPARMPADETACRAGLTALGVRFEEAAQLTDAAGCSVSWPVSVTALAKDVELTPAAVLNCATASRAARFVREEIGPKAKSILGSAVVTIRQDSAYVCRPRNGTGKLSEHAFGNALDIGAFLLADGRSLVVGSVDERVDGEFMLAVRLAACGPFTTVLGPGSDPDHAAHFHFDLAARRSGSLFCQ